MDLINPFLKSHKKWVISHSSSPTSPDFGLASPGVIEVLKAEVNTLRTKISEMEKECELINIGWSLYI